MSGADARAVDLRLGAFFGAYFATVGVFAPYFPLYLEHRGLSALQIGYVLALAQAMRVVGPTLWGWLADHHVPRRTILRVSTLAALVAFAPILLPGGVGLIFAVVFALNVFMTAQIPIAEAVAAAALRHDTQAAARYGRLRIWGSSGFVLLVLVSGGLFDTVGIGWQPMLVLAMLAVTAWIAFGVIDVAAVEEAGAQVSVRARLSEPRVRWFFLSVALMIFAHGALYTYYSLYLAQLGYSKTVIGLFWIAGVLAEIAFFFTQGRFFTRFGAFGLLSASFVLAALRFLLIAEFATFWWVLLAAQLMHAASFAVHHSASILTVQRWFPGRAAARGQALYISVGYGVGGTAGSLVSAWLWTAAGPSSAFLASSAAAVLGLGAVAMARRTDAGARPSAA